ncbi:Zinc-binding dehydrogenase, partial [Rhizoctonia solani]
MSVIPATAQAWRFPIDQSTWNGHKSLERCDILISKGLYPRPYSTGPDGQELIPSCDGAGEVVAVGEDVTQWKKGGPVHSFYETWFEGPVRDKYIPLTVGSGTSGCLAQYRVFDAKTLIPIPPHLSYEEAFTIACAAVTTLHSFFEKRSITKDSTVLVLGSGGVSVFGAQLAKAAGARVIATTSSKEKEAEYKPLGRVMELTGGNGVEQVLEVGESQSYSTYLIRANMSSLPRWAKYPYAVAELGQAWRLRAPVFGTNYGELNFEASIYPLPNDGSVRMSGMLVGSKVMCKRLDMFMSEHKIKPVVDRVLGWTKVVEALDYQLGGSHFGKVVIKID